MQRYEVLILSPTDKIYALIDGYNDNLENINNQANNTIINSMGLVVALVVIIIGVIGYSILLILSIIGFVFAFKNKNSIYRKRNLYILH